MISNVSIKSFQWLLFCNVIKFKCLTVSSECKLAIQYDTLEEFNMDSEAECDQLNLAHVARKKKKLNNQMPVST